MFKKWNEVGFVPSFEYLFFFLFLFFFRFYMDHMSIMPLILETTIPIPVCMIRQKWMNQMLAINKWYFLRLPQNMNLCVWKSLLHLVNKLNILKLCKTKLICSIKVSTVTCHKINKLWFSLLFKCIITIWFFSFVKLI